MRVDVVVRVFGQELANMRGLRVMRMKKSGGCLIGAALVSIASAGGALAQDVGPSIKSPETTIPERQSVLERPRSDYDPLGIRIGSFLAFPSVGLGETYDSNVFATSNNTKSDFYTTVSPSIAVRSDWNVHALGFSASSNTKRYASHVSENVTNFAVRADGRLDILRNIYAQGGASYQLLHEDRSSPDSVNGKNPVEFHVTSANLSYIHEPGRLGARIDGTVDSYSYNNATASSGATIQQHDRDRLVYAVAPRISYEIVPGYHAFTKLTGNERDYVQKFDSRGFQRSSRGWEVDVGTAIDLTHVVNGEVFAGYLSQYYDDSRLATDSGFAFGGNLLWNVTQLTSLRATMSRSVEETTQFATINAANVNASGYLQSAIKLAVEHELLRNVLLSGYVDYINADYQGITRTDDQYDANIGGRYLLNRNLSATADLTYSSRSSNVSGVGYDRVVGILGLRAGF
jgi:hypothetical protein